MTAKMTVLKTDKQKFEADAQETLEDAIKEKFETVLIIGIKDDKAHFKNSRVNNMTGLIGMIEAAKLELWRGGNDHTSNPDLFGKEV